MGHARDVPKPLAYHVGGVNLFEFCLPTGALVLEWFGPNKWTLYVSAVFPRGGTMSLPLLTSAFRSSRALYNLSWFSAKQPSGYSHDTRTRSKALKNSPRASIGGEVSERRSRRICASTSVGEWSAIMLPFFARAGRGWVGRKANNSPGQPRPLGSPVCNPMNLPKIKYLWCQLPGHARNKQPSTGNGQVTKQAPAQACRRGQYTRSVACLIDAPTTQRAGSSLKATASPKMTCRPESCLSCQPLATP